MIDIKNSVRTRVIWIDIIRVLLTIFVVIGHSTYYNIETLFGGIKYGRLMTENNIVDTSIHHYFGILVNWIYTFHMPVFFAVSGVLFRKEIDDNKYGTVRDVIIKKGKRLLIPLLIVWVIWNIPLKLATGYYEGISVVGMFTQMILCKDVSYWFLEALFFSFVIVYLVVKKIKKPVMQLVLLFCMCIAGIILQKRYALYIPLGNPFKYSLWVWIGMNTDHIEKALKKLSLWNPIGISILFGLGTILYILQRHDTIPLKLLCNNTIKPLAIYIVLVYLSKALSNRFCNESKCRRLVTLSGYSFGVYLYADTLNYVILRVVYNAYGIASFGNGLTSFVIIFLRAVITPAIAIMLVWLLRKIRIKYIA